MTFTYETRTTKITYETKSESLERGYDYSSGILDDFANFLRGCGFPLDRDETITVYDPETEVILDREELDGMREDLIELEVLREGKKDVRLPLVVFDFFRGWMAKWALDDSILGSTEVRFEGTTFRPLFDDDAAKADEITDCDAKSDNGWIKWEGGPCPVSGDTMVECMFTAGSGGVSRAGDWRWNNTGHYDIVAYRVLEES